MNTNSKMRYLINIYWDMIWIDDLYTKYKPLLNIKNAKELSDPTKLKIIDKFKTWIEVLEKAPEMKDIYKNSMLDQLKKN